MGLDFANLDTEKLIEATYETFYMTLIAVIGTFVIGLLLGLLLYLTTKDGLWENKWINFVTATFVNVFWAIPSIILLLFLFPFTHFLIGTIRVQYAAVPALIIGRAPCHC